MRPLGAISKSESVVSTAPSGERLWSSLSNGWDYKIRISGDYVYVQWTNLPDELKSTAAFVSMELKKTSDKWKGKKIAYLPATMRQALPRRVHNALWHHEYAARTYYLDYRWTLVCTGLEALLHTDTFASTFQFAARVPLLASEFGITISETEARMPTICGLSSLMAPHF